MVSDTDSVVSDAILLTLNIGVPDSHWPQPMAAMTAVLFSLGNSRRCTLVTMEFDGRADSAPSAPDGAVPPHRQ